MKQSLFKAIASSDWAIEKKMIELDRLLRFTRQANKGLIKGIKVNHDGVYAVR